MFSFVYFWILKYVLFLSCGMWDVANIMMYIDIELAKK